MTFFLIPIWAFTDFPLLMAEHAIGRSQIIYPAFRHTAIHSVAYYILLNGVVHVAQDIAFVIRVCITRDLLDCLALQLVCHNVHHACLVQSNVHPIHSVGTVLTFLWLWFYNNAKGEIARGETRRLGVWALHSSRPRMHR